jgi:hypothetical protein
VVNPQDFDALGQLDQGGVADLEPFDWSDLVVLAVPFTGRSPQHQAEQQGESEETARSHLTVFESATVASSSARPRKRKAGTARTGQLLLRAGSLEDRL